MVHHADTHQNRAGCTQQRPENTQHTPSRQLQRTQQHTYQSPCKVPQCLGGTLPSGICEGEDDNIERLFEQY